MRSPLFGVSRPARFDEAATLDCCPAPPRCRPSPQPCERLDSSVWLERLSGILCPWPGPASPAFSLALPLFADLTGNASFLATGE
ncbi:hypothetical protein ONE63_009755 [Megalurothrips usitatus]|uniref:Uncharacterized protein n=1 Tax=Megalurothrips usitatus TaxID=439358 RepID=A0AAV7XFN7_9NEOP|nr:hypothetical protein ONE63_009755 [Megalurothrips usitatus]